MDDFRSSLSRPRLDAVARSLTLSLDRSRRRRFMPVTPFSRSVNNTSSWIWCRGEHRSKTGPDRPRPDRTETELVQTPDRGLDRNGTGAQGDREAEVFQVSNDDTAMAKRRLEDKQLEDKTNTDRLVKKQKKVHLGINVGANITVNGVHGQEGTEGNVAEKKKVNESMKANLRKLLKETKARTLLLQSLPEDHMADFHHLDDARKIWLAVKARFGGNEESKKIRKTMLKQEFSEFRVSEEEGLHKGYDRDGRIGHQMADGYALTKDQQLGHFARECNVKKVDEKARYYAFKISEVKTKKPKAMVSVDSMLNWNEHEAETKIQEGEQVYGLMAGFESNFAHHAGNAAGSVNNVAAKFAMMGMSPKATIENKEWEVKLDESLSREVKSLNERFVKAGRMHEVPPPITGTFMPTSYKSDLEETQATVGSKSNTSSINTSDSNDFVSGDNSDNKSHLIKDCDVYDSVDNFPSVISKAASVPAGSRNSSASTSAGRSIPTASRNRPTSIHAGRHIPAGRFNKPAPFSAGRSVPIGWTNHVARPFFRPINLYFNNVSWPGVYEHMSMNEGRWGSAVKSSEGCSWRYNRPYIKRGPRTMVDLINLHGFVNPHVNKDIDIVDSGCSRSMTGNKEKLDDFVQIKGCTITFGGGDGKITGKGTIRTSKLNFENVYYVKELQNFNLFSVSQICDKKNKVLFTDDVCLVLTKEFQLPDESQVVLRIPKRHDLYAFNLSDIQPEQQINCLLAKASLEESTKWHRRMAHVNFKTINKLAKHGLVDGLPLKLFTNEHNYVVYNKGKQHKASYKAISAVRNIFEPLQLLRMDLCGPTSIRSIDKKYYSLVVTDDFSRFSWAFFLGTKDETFYILKDFIALIENQLNKKVKAIRCDNGTGFRNSKLIALCGEKGIKRDYSNARTLQQNGVAERKNKTLIEAARSMLADSKLPTMFWIEAVSTACYVLNRVSITSPHNKTSFELLSGKVPNIHHLKPFGCQVTILNTSDHLGKFEGKANDGFLVGYAAHSTQVTNLPAGAQDDDSESECDEQAILVPSFPSNSFSGPTINEVSANMENHLDYAEELARIQRQEHEAHSVAAKYGFEFSNKTAEMLHQAEIETHRNLVLAAGDPAGSIVSTGGVSVGSVPAGSIPASHVPASSVSASHVPASSIPAIYVPAGGVLAGSIVSAGFGDPPASEFVSAVLPPNHAANSTLPLGLSLGSSEHSTRFPSPSDLENHQPTVGIFSSSSYDDDFYADVTNLASSVAMDPVATKRKSKFGENAFFSYVHNHIRTNHTDHLHCLFACFLSQLEPSSVAKALEDPDWVAAMQEEMQQFYNQQVWKLVPLPDGKIAIETKWILKNKRDAKGRDGKITGKGTIRTSKLNFENVYYVEELQHFNSFSISQISDKKNKVLFTDDECLVLTKEFQLPDESQVVLRIPIRHDLYTFKLSDIQPEQHINCLLAKLSLEESTKWHRRMEHVNFKTINKIVKALYGLHQAPRAWHIILVQVYVDDIIFGFTNQAWCDEFEVLMKGEFEMSAMGELTFFLGLQVKQLPDGIFISQDKYVKDMLKKFDIESVRTATTPYEVPKPKSKDEPDDAVNVHLYRSMIGSFMYLTASRPDIMFIVSTCSRHQLEAYSDSDYAGSHGDRKSITGGCQFLGRRLISWQCKKQTVIATFSTEAEYVAAASCCGQSQGYVGFSKLGRLKDVQSHQVISLLFGRRHIDLESHWRDLQIEVRRERYSRPKLLFQNLQILFKVDFDQGFEGLRLSSFARVLGFIKGAQGDREAEVFQVSNDDTSMAQRRLEDKQIKEKTNTDRLVKKQENVHLGIKVGANITAEGLNLLIAHCEDFPLLKQLPTASEDKFPLLIQSDATADVLCAAVEYLQHKHYALWEVIEFGDSYVVPTNDTVTVSVSEGTSTKKGRTVTLTTKDMQKRRNDVKARTTLLLALPDEHQLRFSKYKTAQELWAAILKTFGGNEATKKTKKNLLKQQYGNFKAEGKETLEQTFNRLQAIVSQLEFMDVEIEQDDLNQKLLTSLSPEWLMHTIVWRNRSDLDTMSLDDLYNHLKVYESEVQKKSESNSGNMAFISSAKYGSRNEEVNTASVFTASTNVSPTSANIGAASISQDIACAYIASQSNDREEYFHLRTDMAGFDKSKVECFNCHKMGHFARECRAPRSNTEEEETITDKGLRIEYLTKELENLKNEKEVPFPPPAQVYSPPKKDLSWTCIPELADDTVTDYSRPSPAIESTSDDAQNRNPSVLEIEASPSTISSKPFIKFVKAADPPTVAKLDKKETVRKPYVKYVELYRKPTKRSNVRGNQRNWNNLKSQQLGNNFVMKKACYNCGGIDHLSYDCGKRVDHESSWAKNKNTHKSKSSRPAVHKTHRPQMRPIRPYMNAAQPKRTSFHKPSHSYNKRPFQRTSAVRSQ
nr:putative ribonuclease H-like domain-containing protein [Tanacetum cinerariifolium]